MPPVRMKTRRMSNRSEDGAKCMAKGKYDNQVRAAAEFLGVWLFVLVFIVLWAALLGYSPDALVSVDGVPRILQGETDWGEANIFAAYVVGHFLFGAVGCVMFAVFRGNGSQSRSLERMLAGMVVAWGVSNVIILYSFVNAINSEAVGARPEVERYYVCDYLQVLFLFVVAYAASVVWIRFWAWKGLSLSMQVKLAPAMLLLLGIVCADGITAKAGRVVAGDDIIPYHANGRRHAALLEIHRFCTACTGGDAAIPR